MHDVRSIKWAGAGARKKHCKPPARGLLLMLMLLLLLLRLLRPQPLQRLRLLGDQVASVAGGPGQHEVLKARARKTHCK
jgi:hypothetical protein